MGKFVTWTSAKHDERLLDRSMMARFDGLFIRDRFANEISAITRVMMMRPSKRCFRKSNKAFCIMSVTSYPFRLGPTSTTGRIDGTTSYGDDVSCFLKNGFRFSFVGGVANGVLPWRDGPIESDSSPLSRIYGEQGQGVKSSVCVCVGSSGIIRKK